MPKKHPTIKKKGKVKEPQYQIDRFVYFFAFAAPLFEIPQLYNIYSQKSAENVSLLTWAFFSVASLAWLLYALKHKLKPLLISYILFLIIEVLITIGIIIYR